MRAYEWKKIGVVFLFLVVLWPSPASAGTPSDQLRQTVDKVLSILKDDQLKSPDKKAERRNQLLQVISARFDFQEMAKRSLGTNWQRLSAQEQPQFVQIFTALLERSYTDQIESFNGEKIVYGRENASRDNAQVDTKIVTQKGEELSVNYKLHPDGQEWKVYDVVIEDISLVNNYRSQFNRLLAKSSPQDFLRTLKDKQLDAPGKAGSKADRQTTREAS